MKKEIKNIDELKNFAKYFLENIKKNEVQKNAQIIILNGDLGSGKTTFVKQIAKILEIKNNINSPTFTISKKYKISKNKNWENLIHLDLYRLKNKKELSFIGLENDIKNEKNIIFIEWPEIAKNILSIIDKKNISKINIKYIDKDSREIECRI